MKWRMTIPRWGLVALLGLAAMVALFPMRIAMDWIDLNDAGFTAREVRGSVWSATLSEAQFGGASLGDVEGHVSPLSLLFGRVGIDFNGAERLAGNLSISKRSSRIVIERALIEDVDLPGNQQGLVRLTGFEARFVDGSCIEASGLVSIVVIPTTGISAPPLANARIRCDAGAISIALPVAGGGLRVGADGLVRLRN